MEKNSNDNNMQGKCSVKSAVTFDQIQVPYFDFKLRPTKIESLRGLLYPTIDKHGSAKANNKQKKRSSNFSAKANSKKVKVRT